MILLNNVLEKELMSAFKNFEEMLTTKIGWFLKLILVSLTSSQDINKKILIKILVQEIDLVMP